MKLEKISALITGGTQGLGKAFVSNLLRRGANVVVADIDQKSGIDMERKMFRQYGKHRLKFVQCDVSDIKDLHRTFEYSKEQFGRLDVVCNNAVITTSDGNLASKQVANKMAALIEGTYKGIELMSVKNGGNGGVVVNISSSSGYNIMKGKSVYTAMKYGVVGFSRSFKFLSNIVEDEVRVNCICPFFFDAKMLQKDIVENPEVRYQLSHFGYADMDDVTKAFMMCIQDNRLNGEVIAAYAHPHLIQFGYTV